MTEKKIDKESDCAVAVMNLVGVEVTRQTRARLEVVEMILDALRQAWVKPRRSKASAVVLALLALAGCSSLTKPVQYAPCNAAAFEPYSSSGTAEIAGQAFLRTQGGLVMPAAGSQVVLVPATDCALDWWETTGKHAKPLRDGYPAGPVFENAARLTVADADGRFRFSGLPAGDYFIRTSVRWFAGRDLQGGFVSARLTISDGEKIEAVLTW